MKLVKLRERGKPMEMTRDRGEWIEKRREESSTEISGDADGIDVEGSSGGAAGVGVEHRVSCAVIRRAQPRAHDDIHIFIPREKLQPLVEERRRIRGIQSLFSGLLSVWIFFCLFLSFYSSSLSLSLKH